MTDGYITDRNHLYKRVQDGIAALLDLEDAWLEEDATACAPRSGSSVSVSGSGPSDPTRLIATDDQSVDQAKYRDRDRLGSALLRHVSALEQLVRERQPRETSGPCRCCETRTATHGDECWWCWRFVRRHGVRCTDEAHEAFPEPARFCECPRECCDPCTDEPSDRRATISDRCAMRKSRGQWRKAG